MDLIAVVDNNWGIGNGGKLLFNLPPDLQRFKEMTMDNVVVMGRKTLQSLPQGAPLKGRINVVLSSGGNCADCGARVVNTIVALHEELAQYGDKKVYVIGGASVYSQLIASCETAYITKVHARKEADSHIANFDTLPNWRLYSSSPTMEYCNLMYTYAVYKRIKNEL